MFVSVIISPSRGRMCANYVYFCAKTIFHAHVLNLARYLLLHFMVQITAAGSGEQKRRSSYSSPVLTGVCRALNPLPCIGISIAGQCLSKVHESSAWLTREVCVLVSCGTADYMCQISVELKELQEAKLANFLIIV